MNRICVYCGSSAGVDEQYVDAARELATLLVSANIDLVYGGATKGLMGVIADTVLQNGGRVRGVI
ncbi:MAG: TIGR00730 family Rossman fold protein, partial [Gammaproteobacteria bacterium]|nr:TIGR00730 family Rossman fold protein [Gammaproteobacteria bacterium]